MATVCEEAKEKATAVSFTVGFDDEPKKKPRRLPKNLSSERLQKRQELSHERLAEKQRLAEERRKVKWREREREREREGEGEKERERVGREGERKLP